MRPQSTRICPVCGNPFTRNGHDEWTKTCSRACGCRMRHGDPVTRLWAKVDRSAGLAGCWPWTARRNKDGYGQFRYDGKRSAHRIVWELANGPIPNGLLVCHSCDNPACCNPAHMFLGTNLDNATDKVAKGRCPSGAKHVMAKLTNDDVRAIRALYASGEWTQQALAKRFGLSLQNINRAVRRLSYSDVV